jgi:hypothetical protein
MFYEVKMRGGGGRVDSNRKARAQRAAAPESTDSREFQRAGTHHATDAIRELCNSYAQLIATFCYWWF